MWRSRSPWARIGHDFALRPPRVLAQGPALMGSGPGVCPFYRGAQRLPPKAPGQMKTSGLSAREWRFAVHCLVSRWLRRLGLRALRGVVRHSGPVGIDSRTVALAVLSVVAAVVLGFEAGVHAGALAGVLAALAGFVPAVVWELTRDRRERNARVAERRKAALKAFVPAVAAPAAGGAVAGSPGGHSAAWYLRPEAQVVAFRPRPELSRLREWCVAGGRLGVRLVTGEGGAGKTRLALQLATDLASDGWRTMWVRPRAGGDGGRHGAGYRRARGAGCRLCRDQAGPG